MLELKDFEAAADRLKNVIHNIPLSTSCTFSAMTGAEVYLKYENQQKTGSFKVRGAYNKIMKRFAEATCTLLLRPLRATMHRALPLRQPLPV